MSLVGVGFEEVLQGNMGSAGLGFRTADIFVSWLCDLEQVT